MNQAPNSESKTHAGKQNRTSGTDLSSKRKQVFLLGHPVGSSNSGSTRGSELSPSPSILRKCKDPRASSGSLSTNVERRS